MPNFEKRGGVLPKPGDAPDISQLRQSLNRLFATPSTRSMAATAADEPLIVELAGPTPGTHWVLSCLAAIGLFKTRTLVAGVDSPVAGLFLLPESGGEPFGDSASDATSAGWNFEARGFPIPVEWKSVALGGGLGFAFSCVSKLALPLVVPAGFSIRLIANVAPGTATPGPGVGSFGRIQGWGTTERDV